jgi:hypothetical protein
MTLDRGMPHPHRKIFFRDVLTRSALLGLLMALLSHSAAGFWMGWPATANSPGMLPEMHASNPYPGSSTAHPHCASSLPGSMPPAALLKAQKELLEQLIPAEKRTLYLSAPMIP